MTIASFCHGTCLVFLEVFWVNSVCTCVCVRVHACMHACVARKDLCVLVCVHIKHQKFSKAFYSIFITSSVADDMRLEDM